MKEIKKRVVIFGTGKFYSNRKRFISKMLEDIKIVAFLDNDIRRESLEGVHIFPPSEINEITYDEIVVMSKSADEMTRQLVSYGVDENCIYGWLQFLQEYLPGYREEYIVNKVYRNQKVLIIANALDYTGATMAIFYMSLVLMNNNWDVYLSALNGDDRMIGEMNNAGINVIIYPGMEIFGLEEEEWLAEYDVVIVNTFPMIKEAFWACNIRPTMWWLHEAQEYIQNTIEKENLLQYKIVELSRTLKKINIYAVADVSMKNFNRVFEDGVCKTLPYGIPDKANRVLKATSKERLIFAMIGTICKRKAQDIFLKAAKMIGDDMVEFLLIGKMGNDEYSYQIKELAKDNKKVVLLDETDREGIDKLFENNIDVLVCPSREDPMPIVCTEAMMYYKPVITSNCTGTAMYIEEGINGFTFANEDVQDLRNKLQWMIMHRDKIYKMGKNARKVYDDNFSMKKFGENVTHAIKNTINDYGMNCQEQETNNWLKLQ